MLSTYKNNQILIGVLLALLIFITRGHHIASISFLPSATLAVFFMAGFYLTSRYAFPALLMLCVGLDLYSVTYGNTSSFCMTPAYVFLLPAYGTMWLAGRFFAKRFAFNIASLFKMAEISFFAAVVSELFSSGGFYFLGGRYTNPTLSEFGVRLIKFFPHQLENLSIWLLAAVFVHVLIHTASLQRNVKV